MYNSGDIANRIKTLAKQEKKAVKDILTEAGLSKNSLTNFKTSMPKADNLAKIADNLNCSVDYLLGRTKTTVELVNLSDEFIHTVIEQFPDELDGFITKKELSTKIITPPRGTKYYNVEASRYHRIIEIYELANEFNSDELSNIIESQKAFELLFEPHEGLFDTGFWRGFRLSKANYDNVFIKVYNLYVKSYAAKVFISFRENSGDD